MRHRISWLVVSTFAVTAAWPMMAAAQEKKLTNAALRTSGARVSVEHPGDVVPNSRTTPEHSFDGSPHSRMVFTGVPYTFTVELPDRLPIDHLSFAQTDYQEAAPKDLRIELDDGTVIEHTLELKRSQRRKAAWQDVPIHKQVQVIRITVLSNHEGDVKWGGMGDIAIWTPVDLKAQFELPSYDPQGPTYVHVPEAGQASDQVFDVTLPEKVKAGVHPSLILSPEQVKALREKLASTERGKAALDHLKRLADDLAAADPVFPDPKGPMAQMKSRNDAPAKAHNELSEAAGTLGRAYALTGEAKYAQAAAKILVGYADLYDQYPEHKGVNGSDTGKVMAQRLSEAMWLMPLIQGYDGIHDSDALTDAQREAIEEKLIRPCILFIRRRSVEGEVARRDRERPNWRTEAPPVNRKVMGNWVNFYAAATMMAGAVLDDRDLVDLAADDFRNLIRNGIGADGMWGEGAIGYQLFALQAMVPGMEAAAHQGIDLWSFDDNRVKLMFDTPLRFAYPDGTLPGINDSGRGRLSGWTTMIYDYGYLRYGDPGYAAYINESPQQLQFSPAVYLPSRIYEDLDEPQAIKAESTVFNKVGYAILRNDKAYTLMDYGPHGGPHGHQDKLNLLLFAMGDELGGEPVFHRYEDPLHGQWTRQTVAHNTMSVDQRSQLSCTGRLLLYEDGEGIQLMRGQTNGAYPGVLLDRTVVVLGDRVLDVYHGRSRFEHTWDRTMRFQGTLEQLGASPRDGEPLGTRDGYQHVSVIDRTSAEQAWSGSWQTKVGPLQVAVAGAPGQEMILATGPDGEHMALARQQGRTSDFAMFYAPRGEGESVRFLDSGDEQVAAVEADGEAGMVRLFVAHKPGEWEALGWRSDARALCVVEQAGKPTRVLLAGGTFAESGKGVDAKLELAGNAVGVIRDGTWHEVSAWSPEP